MSLPNEVSSLMFAQQEYQIARSLRFNSADSAYLNRTFGTATSATIYTLSLWVKRGLLSTSGSYGLFSASSSDYLRFNGEFLDLGVNLFINSAGFFRDPSAWYHIVYQRNGNTYSVYVNNVLTIQLTTTLASSINTAVAHQIGAVNTTNYLDGYLTEINFIDGQALSPSSFAVTSPTTGVWIPKKYTGTYGNNGFYLTFSDNSATTSTTLGKDSSGNGNNWTPNNFSVTAGVGNDSLTDTPTNNFATWNPIWEGRTNAPVNGNLDYGASSVGIATFGLSTGKWYWEVTSTGGTSTVALRSTSVTSSTTVTTTNTKGLRFDADAGTFDWTSDGSSWSSIATGLTSGPYFPYVSTAASTTASLNAGQRSFAYTVPSGYRAINTQNLPIPTILNGSKFMNAVTWTGTGATRSITGVGFQPDLVWSKSRSNAETHKLVDSARGATKALSSETTGDEVTESGITSFDADGFTIDGTTDTGYNTNTYTYVGWAWKKGVTPGFDIVTYTGNGSARTISHSLGAVPHFMIVKARTTAGADQGWPVYHRNLTSSSYYTLLDAVSAQALDTTVWNATAPTSSVFSVGTSARTNTNNDTYLAYLFTEISGFSRFDGFTGNGSTDGPFVWCGFRPRFVLIKHIGGSVNWIIYDTVRNSYAGNPCIFKLYPNLSASNQESNTGQEMDILSNGFKMRASDGTSNATGQPYIFAAFAENPFKYSRAR